MVVLRRFKYNTGLYLGCDEMNKKIKYLLTVSIAIVLSVITHIIPMFLSVPKYIYLNIAGTAMIALVFGPLGGGIYAGLLHLLLNNIGMGMGTQIPVLITQVIQGLLLGFTLKYLKTNFKIIIIPVFMALISLPINTIIYSVFNSNLVEKLKNLPFNYLYYVKNNLVDNILMYFISIVVSIIIIKILHLRES